MKLTSVKEFMNEHYRVDEKSQEELIKYYEKNLEKVKTVYRDDDLKKEYISFAQGQLDAVKSGGMKELQKFWKNNKVNEKVEIYIGISGVWKDIEAKYDGKTLIPQSGEYKGWVINAGDDINKFFKKK